MGVDNDIPCHGETIAFAGPAHMHNDGKGPYARTFHMFDTCCSMACSATESGLGGMEHSRNFVMGKYRPFAAVEMEVGMVDTVSVVPPLSNEKGAHNSSLWDGHSVAHSGLEIDPETGVVKV